MEIVKEEFKIELPYEPAILLLVIYPKKHNTLIRKDICTPLFITSLFTIATNMEATQMPINR